MKAAKTRRFVSGLLLVAAAALAGLPAGAEVKISAGLNQGASATPAFELAGVPAPAVNDAAAKASVILIEGEIDDNSAGLHALIDGRLPATPDEPRANFFFGAGTLGGRIRLDFGKVIDVAQVNTYSWHPDTRAPQVYKLYGSEGTGPKFNAQPGNGTDPSSCGWKLIATVDTRKQDWNDGGQHGVSIRDTTGSLGKYRYLLFSVIATEIDDAYGNTFYSEVDVIAR